MPHQLVHVMFLLLLSQLLLACASAPFDLNKVNRTIQPQHTLDDSNTLGQRVVWGGMIVETKNFKDTSQIEVLGFALDDIAEPIRSSQAQRRFLVKHRGFLEPGEYSAGRWLSVLGQVKPSQPGQVGEAKYQYPVLEAEQLHIWPEGNDSDVQTRFHFGIGIRL